MERPPSSTIPTAFSVSDWPAPDLSISSLPSYEVVEDIYYTELSPEAGYYLPYSQLTGDLPFGQYYDFGDPIPGNSTRQPLNDDAVDFSGFTTWTPPNLAGVPGCIQLSEPTRPNHEANLRMPCAGMQPKVIQPLSRSRPTLQAGAHSRRREKKVPLRLQEMPSPRSILRSSRPL